MNDNCSKKPIDRQDLEDMILARARKLPACRSVREIRIKRLARPALSNWTIVDRDLGKSNMYTCVRELAQIMTDLQEEFFLDGD